MSRAVYRVSRVLYCVTRPDGSVIQRSVAQRPRDSWELAIIADRHLEKRAGANVHRPRSPLLGDFVTHGLSLAIFRAKRLGYRVVAARVVTRSEWMETKKGGSR